MRAGRAIRAIHAMRAVRAGGACVWVATLGTNVMGWIMAVLLVTFGVWNAGVRSRVESRGVRDPAQERCGYVESVFWYLQNSGAADF